MGRLSSVTKGLRFLFDKGRADREIDEELDDFLESATARKRGQGLSAEEARSAALAEVGSRNAVKHQVWSSRWEAALDNFFQDVRVSQRALVRNPAFACVAVLSLALGIGANTAIFTLIHQVLLRNLPVRNPEQLVTLGDATNSGVAGGIDIGQYGMFPWYFARQLADDPGPFQGIAAQGSFAVKVTVRMEHEPGVSDNGPARLASAGLVSGNYFAVLGAHALMGRTITPADDAAPGAGAVAVVSFHFWQTSLSSDPMILGKTITLNGTPFELIGVMPRGFEGIKQDPELTDLWTPSTMQAVILQQPSMLTADSGLYFMNMFARLSPGAVRDRNVMAQSQAWLDRRVHAGIRAHEGGTQPAARQQEIERETVPLIAATRGVTYLRSEYDQSLRILMAVVAIVLLIACANLANFLLARGTSRQREIATRLALGSSRARIVRQGLIETVLLSMLGGIAGLGLAYGATRALIVFVSHGISYVAVSPAPDATVLLFTFGVSILTGVLFGLGPAVAGARIEAHGSLSSSNRASHGGAARASRLWPKSLVVAQVVLSLLLLVTAGLFLRTLRNLEHQDYGFERTHLLLAQLDAQLAGYTPVRTSELHQNLLDRLSAIPGVQSAALAGTPPISSGNWRSNIELSGYTPAPKEHINSILNRVSGRYFETAGIQIVSGRPISPSDSANGVKVAVVNQNLAQRYFPHGDAVGHWVTIGIDTVRGPWQIVGIARDTRSGDPKDQRPTLMTYIPLAQIDPFAPAAAQGSEERPQNNDCFAHLILLRTASDPAKTIPALRAAVAAVDPNLPLLSVTTIREEVSNMIGDDELSSSLTGIFALLALVLAAIGLYGVMSYNVAQRTNEIGVRMALGAPPKNVLWMVLKEALLLLATGVLFGLPLSLAAARLIRQQLFGLDASDPLTYAIALAAVAGMVMLSSWLPARRAASVNPVDALRCE